MPASIRDHALLSDCQTAALMTSGGAVDWWPAPRFDAPSAFSALVDDDAGHWTIRPAEPFEASWAYRPGTLVLETTMRTASGTLLLTDALALAPGASGHEIGREVPRALARLAEVLAGEVTVCMDCVPKLEYGLAVPRFRQEDDGCVATAGGPERLSLRSDAAPLQIDGSAARSRVRLAAGQSAAWVLHRAAGTYAPAPARLDARETLADATRARRSWSGEHAAYEGLHAASLVFRGLTYQPTGALMAAPMTSLPEIAGGDASWTTATAGCATPR